MSSATFEASASIAESHALGTSGEKNLRLATLIAVYRADSPEAFAAALDSVFEQRLPPSVESRVYLGVDGELPASLEQVVDERRAMLFRIVRSPSNRGLAATLNALIAVLADEAFVFRMDADDRCLPDRYQRQLAYMSEHPDVDIVGAEIIEVDSVTGRRRRIAFARDHDEALRRMAWRVPVAHPTVCMRRCVLQRVGSYPMAGTNEDIALWFRCMAAGLRFGNVPEPLLEFNIGPSFWARRGWRKAWLEFRCYTHGLWLLHGLGWRHLVPLARLALRLSPRWLARAAYGSRRLRGGGDSEVTTER